MRKIKLFSSSSLYDVENEVNDWLSQLNSVWSTCNILDTKFSTTNKSFDIMIIYETV